MSVRTLATATTLKRMVRYINDFWCSTNYRIDGETLAIYIDRGESRAAAPAGFYVEAYRGGWRFIHRGPA